MTNDRWRDEERERYGRGFEHGSDDGRSDEPDRDYRRDRRYGGTGYYGTLHGGGTYGTGRWQGGYGEDWRRYADRGRDFGSEWRDIGSQDWRREHGGARGWWDRTKDEVRSWMGDADAEERRRMDHQGRGPRGYTRSDARISEDINDRLTDDWGVDATDIEVAVSNGEVTLTGSVDSRMAKRRAEDIAAYVSGVKDVQNNLRVKRAAQYEGQHEGQYEGQHEGKYGTSETHPSSSTTTATGATTTGTGTSPRH